MKICCSFCCVEDEATDGLIELSDGRLICDDCLDNGALPRRVDSWVLVATGYAVERS